MVYVLKLCAVFTHTNVVHPFTCCYIHNTHSTSTIQVVKDFRNIIYSSKMEHGSDVTIKNVDFDAEEDPVVAARPIFVTA